MGKSVWFGYGFSLRCSLQDTVVLYPVKAKVSWKNKSALYSLRVDIHSILIFHSYPLSTSIRWLSIPKTSPQSTSTRQSTSSQQTRRRKSIPIIPSNTMNSYFTRTCTWKKVRIVFELSPSRCRTLLMRPFKMEKDKSVLEVKNNQAYDIPWCYDYNPSERFYIP